MKKTLITIVTLVVAVMAASAAHGQTKWASLKGQFVYGGKDAKVPAAAKLTPTKDVEVCGKHQLFNESLVINEENRGIANVVIWAYNPKSVHDDYKATAEDTVVIDNIGCRFEPHTVVVRTGQTLTVKNSDPVGHNSLINFMKNNPVNPIIPAGGKVDFELTKAELLPLPVSCSIHPWMQGKVLVQDHPYMAVTDKDGKFELKNLPAGKLTLKVWHESPAYVQEALVDGKKAAWKKGRYAISLKGDEEHTYTLDPKIFK